MINDKTITIAINIQIDKRVNDIMNWYTHNYKEEICGWLLGETNETGIHVEEIIFGDQTVTKGNVISDTKGLLKLRKDYGDKCLKIIGHWHSHNTMGAFWSSTDDEFISDFMLPRERAIFIVSSKKDEHKIRVELRKPFLLSLDNLNYKICDEELKTYCENIIKTKVKVDKVITQDFTQKLISAPNITNYNKWKHKNYDVHSRDYDAEADYYSRDEFVDDEEIEELFNDDEFANREVINNEIERQFHEEKTTSEVEIKVEEFLDMNKKNRTIKAIGLLDCHIAALNKIAPSSSVKNINNTSDVTYKFASNNKLKKGYRFIKSYLVDYIETHPNKKIMDTKEW